MKKLFTLIAAALLAVGANAQHDVGKPTNGAIVSEGDDAGTWFDESTMTINFLKAWNYRPGWWLAWNNETSANTGNDFSEYDEFVVELSDIPNGMTVQCQIEDVDGKSASAQTTNADSKIVVPLSKIDKTKVRQAYLQANSTGSVKFVKAYFQTSSPTKDIDFSGMSSVWGGGSYDAGTKTITQGTGGVGLAWYSSQPDFSKYDYMVVEFAEPTKEKAKIAIVYNDDTNSGEAGAFNANCKRKVIALKDVSKSAIKQIYVQGGSEGCTFVLSKMYVAKSDYITENNIVDEYALTDTESLSLVNLDAGWNANYDSSTKKITVEDGVDAGGKGWWFGESTGADYSHYDNVVIEFEPTTSEGNVEVQYNGAENKKVNFYLGATCVVIPLDATGKSNIKCIQIAGGPNDTFILKAAYVAISSKTPAEALGITWTVAGQELLMGSNWSEGDKKNNMTSTDGVNYTLVKEGVYLEQGGSYMYKVVQNHSWDNDSYGEDGKTDGSNAYLNISETGKYKLTFSFNSDTKKPTVTAVKTSDADVTIHDMYSVIGTIIGNWDTDTEMTKGDNGIFTATIANVNAGSYEFKVRVDKDWTFSYPSSNYQLTVDSDGSTVTFTYNPATYEVKATVTPPTGIEALTIDTDANALMYNLAGQRVNKDYKGVVIKNGKKVVVK